MDSAGAATRLIEQQPMARAVPTPWCQRTETRGPVAEAPTGEAHRL